MEYQFKGGSLDLQQQKLVLAGNRVEADERIFRLLHILIDAYPQSCSQQQLLDTIWPDTVVSNWSVGRLISDTRKLFKEHGIEAEVIHTLHGRGYRLGQTFAEQLNEPTSQKKPSVPSPRSKSRYSVLGIVFAIVAFFAVVAIYLLDSDPPQLVTSEPADSVGRLLWIDDNPGNIVQEKEFFERHNITVYVTTTTEEAMLVLSMYDFKAIISDMGRHDQILAGLHLLDLIRESDISTPFFLYTIVQSEAKQKLIAEHGGQGVAVTSQQLYDFILPLYSIELADNPPN